MADFCTKCAHNLFGDSVQPDIDVALEFSELEEGMGLSGFLCESCELHSIVKIGGELLVLRGDAKDWEQY